MSTILLILSIVTDFSLPYVAPALPDPDNQPRSQCGINSLYSCLRFSGIGLPLERLYSEIACDADGRVNLYQLAEYARRQGLHTKAVERPDLRLLRRYLRSGSSAMLQFETANEGEHIVALLKTQDEMWLFDFPLSKRVVSEEFVNTLFTDSGGMLIVSLAPLETSIVDALNSSRNIGKALLVVSMCVLMATAMSVAKNRREKSGIHNMQRHT